MSMVMERKIGGRKCKVRKRVCSSSSSSSLVQNYRLKRAFLVGKRVGSSTPVPMWKMMTTSKSSSLGDNDNKAFKCKEYFSVSARKLAATLWGIDGLEDNYINEVALCLSERMDPPKVGSHRRRASAGSQKLLKSADGHLGGDKSLHNCSVEIDQMQNHARSPCRQIVGTRNRLKDVYNGLVTSKELLKVMSRVCRFEEQSSTSLSLFSALKFELDRACIHVSKLIQEQRTNRSEFDILLKQFEEQKLLWKMKEQDRIHIAITSVAGELETEKKLRRQTERLNKKLGRELSETKVALSKTTKDLDSEKRAREILEQVCDELARGVGDDRAEVEELKRESEKVRQEVEKEREMLQLADILREERVQMKLSEAKYQFEEKNEIVDKLRNELEVYLKSKKGEERGDGSPSYDKIKELEKYLRETLPGSYQNEDKVKEDVKGEEEEDEDEDEEDSADDSDLHSIELNMDDLSKSFRWKDESKRNSVDKSKGRKSVSERTKKLAVSSEARFAAAVDGIEYEFSTNNQENVDVLDREGLFEVTGAPWKKKDVEDEMERYNMIKDLRDHIVSGSRMFTSQDNVSPEDPNGVVCHG